MGDQGQGGGGSGVGLGGGSSLVMRDYRKGNWTVSETMVLIEAKRMDEERRTKRGGGNKPAELEKIGHMVQIDRKVASANVVKNYFIGKTTIKKSIES
ncbi:unnamed protein product [Linum trigynum]